ncbi:MAG: GTPase ObgE [Chloroflexi bacterium]|nr:GTPase ObgE [Chloroflexota bacterium]
MFDKVQISVKAGDGGAGAITFRREKFVPFGGPDGGDGGNGGNVIFLADPSVTSLARFRRKRIFLAPAGGAGQSKKRHGKNGEEMVISVPVGTVLSYPDSGEVIADLAEPGQRVLVARGGRGGWGNVHYATSTNQVPRLAQRGETGEEVSLVLEMRLIADVGIIGSPNAGKSTLLSMASAASPRIAAYPFTTTEPVLGVVYSGQRRFILAEIPGLIEGAHLGKGLGHDFLRHILRTRALIHLIDGSSADPVEAMRQINEELSQFDLALAEKPQLVTVNKIDLPEVRSRMDEIRDRFRAAGLSVHFISAATGEGVSELVAKAALQLERMPLKAVEVVKVFRPEPRRRGMTVRREDNVFVVEAPGLERLMAAADASENELRWQLTRHLDRMGLSKKLERAGVRPGDRIRCGELEWEWR